MTIAWKDHLKAMDNLAQELTGNLERNDQGADDGVKKYLNFLQGFRKKLDVLRSADAVRVGRPHSSSEDNICLTFGKFQIISDIMQFGEHRQDGEGGVDPSGQRARKFSFQYHEESEEKRDRFTPPPKEPETSSVLGRRRQNSTDT